MSYKKRLVILLIAFCFHAKASSILLNTKDATVWLPQQIINGSAPGLSSNRIKWHLNNKSGFVIVHKNGSFSFSITLTETNNIIWAEDAAHSNIKSDTVSYILGYKPLPEVKPYAVINSSTATLNLKIINNPYGLPLKFLWKSTQAPSHVSIFNSNKQKASVEIPNVDGNYFFSVTVYAGSDSAVYITYITRNDKSLHAFDIAKDYAAWINSAIVYEITPYVFVKDGQYPDITKKLPELKELGINTIWLQPVYKSHGNEQGYDITDYFTLRTDLGTENQLYDLISTAKSLNMRVLFDFVPNHSSIYHPYAKEVKQYGEQSHYYTFYQHTNDGAEYSSLYQIDADGFVHYFWNDLINLDYSNIEVQQWIIEAFKYWLRKFDIDGYRIDAAWAYNARNTAFGNQLRTALKSIKPDILLLAEDKGATKKVYAEGYDAAYDWRADTNWISSWSWATDYDPPKNPTLFNFYDENKRSFLLNTSLLNNGDTEHLRLRFLENNDQQRFITVHGKERTKMASALLFSLPGLPMIYNGQEIGFERKPYSNKAIFKPNQSIAAVDTNNLFPWYQKLVKLRLKHDALRSNYMQPLPVKPLTMFALHRWKGDENIIVLSNLGSDSLNAQVNIRSIKKSTSNSTKYTDLITKEIFFADADTINVPMEKFHTRILLASKDDSIGIASDK